jgi:hypothetical protein
VRVVVMNPAAHEHLATTVTLGRLAEQFRSDVHAASEASPAEAGAAAQRLKLVRPDGVRVEYELVEDGVRRAAMDGDRVRQQERFVLPGMKVLGWEVAASGQEVSLLVGRLPPVGRSDADGVRYRFPMTARLGRDHRFALGETKNDTDGKNE